MWLLLWGGQSSGALALSEFRGSISGCGAWQRACRARASLRRGVGHSGHGGSRVGAGRRWLGGTHARRD